MESIIDKKDALSFGQVLKKYIGSDDAQDWIKTYSGPYIELMSCYRCALMEVETKFNVLNEEFSLQYDRNPIESIKSRLKSPESIMEKLRRRNIMPDVDEIERGINDIAGVRVITSFTSDIYKISESFLRQDDIKLLRKKDYIAEPKENGYRSLHLIIETPIYLSERKREMKVEVQLRTISMDWWASLEHKIRYKKNIKDSEMISKELLRCADIGAELDKRMELLNKMVSGESIDD